MAGALLRIKPVHAKVLVCLLGLLVFVIDMVVPADLNVAIFYSFVIVLCAWSRSLTFLWITTAIFAIVTMPGLLLSPPPVAGPLSWVDWANRWFGLGALLLVAGFIDLRVRSYRLLEAAVAATEAAEKRVRESEARLNLAQSAGHIGSWEWNPANDAYTWSEECYEIFGINPGDETFASKWMSSIDPVDLNALKTATAKCSPELDFEFDYRYQHPSRGMRWIHARGRMFARSNDRSHLFGIAQDITERKQVESILQQSQSMLEVLVEQRTADLRRLSAELLQAQDEERRKLARELHDSFGQYLAVLKIDLDQLSGAGPVTELARKRNAELLSECLETVGRCIVETRTMSHLLHPPLLDETGFASAARWYVEGFSKRSKIEVRLDLPDGLPRFPDAVELAFFRALQESLTNVHRYSGASAVDIKVAVGGEEVSLTVRDYGRGIPAETIRDFRDHGSGVGIGLSGMRERMKELGGRLELSSNGGGTTVCARIPISKPHAQLARTNVA